MKWDRRYAKPLSDGGVTICEKHDFIEANFRDPDMAYEVCETIAQAKDDGRRMESRLQELGEECNNLEDHANDYDEISAELRRLRISQLRRMAHEASLSADWTRPMTHRGRLFRFAVRCNREIERLRGDG